MNKKLIIWNGIGWGIPKKDTKGHIIPDPTGKEYCDHFYLCATSQSQAIKIIKKCTGRHYSMREVEKCWVKGCWGIQMDNVKPEIGLWTAQHWKDIPKKIY